LIFQFQVSINDSEKILIFIINMIAECTANAIVTLIE